MTKGLTNCPICNFPGIKQHPRSDDFYFFECGRCKEFEASWEIVKGSQDFEGIKTKLSEIGYILSGLSRELYESGQKMPVFMIKNIEETLKHPLIPNVESIEEKIQKFLQHLRRKTKYFGDEIDLGDIETVVPLAYAKNSEELTALFTLITEKKLAKIGTTKNEKNDGKTRVKITLLADGWEITNSLRQKNEKSNRGFIAIWFNDSMNESISAIEKAIDESGFRSVCIKNEQFPETIMEKALGEIRKSRFIVVDLTGERVDVAFEAGFAFGLGIETIYVYDKQKHKDNLPKGFYSRHFKCNEYNNKEELREIIKSAISAIIIS